MSDKNVFSISFGVWQQKTSYRKKECRLFFITPWLWAINWGTFSPLIKQQSCCWNDFFTCISTLKQVKTNIDQFEWRSCMAIYCEINSGTTFERRKPSCTCLMWCFYFQQSCSKQRCSLNEKNPDLMKSDNIWEFQVFWLVDTIVT